ncbi:hypothetical protein THAOC_34680 [Thalassiosira oceanica]|uniref:PH domain-containing protein n=1 Tax=Thalassiosira oceanica TaxID=159749 RepID=K0RIY2_THAOC|nr:hypothetical protein THAOC_34680 [Thalassiosira oceanica]|eukprot:EJK46642.1 hypothetical protein THAOC_34680 [Thalassiosira oceanica]
MTSAAPPPSRTRSLSPTAATDLIVDEVDLNRRFNSTRRTTAHRAPFVCDGGDGSSATIQGHLIGRREPLDICNDDDEDDDKDDDIEAQQCIGDCRSSSCALSCGEMSPCGNIQQDFAEAAETESNDYTQLHDDYTSATDYVTSAVANLASGMSSMTTTLSATYHSSAPPLIEGDVAGVYAIRKTIAQGWLHKKGSGEDWAKQRWWKPRWMTLALAAKADGKADGSDDVLILLSHRAPGVPYPVGILELTKSTVVMAIEKRPRTEQDTCNDAWNRHCFRVIQAGSESSQTRVFTAPLEDRNEWVFALNRALIEHQNQMRNAGRRHEAQVETLDGEVAESGEEKRPRRHRHTGPAADLAAEAADREDNDLDNALMQRYL